MILGIDPGTRKCGYALVAACGIAPAELGIVPTGDLKVKMMELVRRFAPQAIALGGGTHAAAVGEQLTGLGVPVVIVDERATTLLARQRYFAAHPPAGWRRLVPRGMLLPPRPIDDYAAVLIAERLLERDGTGTETRSDAPPR
ncbi:MAG: Holliday junction resolvase RuvX [Vulcanimicrobiaceae bacterium]